MTPDAVYCAGFQHALRCLMHVHDDYYNCPSIVFKITPNNGKDSFYGKRYNVDIVYANDGSQLSAATSVVAVEDRLFISSLLGDGILVCENK